MKWILLLGLLFPNQVEVPETKQNELWWATTVATHILNTNPGGGYTREDGERITEEQLPDGRRIDIFYKDVAWEVDWAKKWPEAIGQSLGYSIAMNSDPGVILLMKHGEDETYNQCLAVITSLRSKGYNMRFMVVNVDNGKIWWR